MNIKNVVVIGSGTMGSGIAAQLCNANIPVTLLDLKTEISEKAKKRIKIGLILNEFAQQNNIKVEEHEIQLEVQKQIRMMPGQEKMVMEFYQKNPSALASLRGNVYEEKIINLIKSKAKANKKDITKDEAEKILKEANAHNHPHDHSHEESDKKKTQSKTKSQQP